MLNVSPIHCKVGIYQFWNLEFMNKDTCQILKESLSFISSSCWKLKCFQTQWCDVSLLIIWFFLSLLLRKSENGHLCSIRCFTILWKKVIQLLIEGYLIQNLTCTLDINPFRSFLLTVLSFWDSWSLKYQAFDQVVMRLIPAASIFWTRFCSRKCFIIDGWVNYLYTHIFRIWNNWSKWILGFPDLL